MTTNEKIDDSQNTGSLGPRTRKRIFSDETSQHETRREACSTVKGKKCKGLVDYESSAHNILSYLKEEALSKKIPLAEASGSQCAHLLFNLIPDLNTCRSLTEKERVFLDNVIKACLELQVDHFRIRDFAAAISSVGVLPLEVLWRLHQTGLLDFISYLSCVSPSSLSDIISHTTQSLVYLLTETEIDSSINKTIICDICTALLICSFSTSKSSLEQKHLERMKKVSGEILDTLTTKILESIFSKQDDALPRAGLFDFIKESVLLDLDTQQKFCIQQLSIIIGYCPTSKEKMLQLKDAYRAISIQDQWCCLKSPISLIKVFIKLLVPLTATKVISLVKQIVETNDINWRSFLTFISTFIAVSSKGKTALQGLINELLDNAFKNNNQNTALACFLMVRQAALEGPYIFPSYDEWFRTSFSSSSNTFANSKQSFAFFMKFLTDLVPFEPVIYLQAHITNPPYIPSKCRALLHDYISLAKARLAELQVDIYEVQKSSEEQKAMIETEEAIHQFSKTQKIPKNITEVWMFHKSYYLNRLLPVLLSSQKSSSSDGRAMLIKALYNSGKIPANMYEDYLKRSNAT